MSKATSNLLKRTKANDALAEAKQLKTPECLWNGIWYEGELCCLFADSNLGKSILAVQIAEEVAIKEPVIYFDFELSVKQFQMRYTNEVEEVHVFPENLYRANVDQERAAECNLDIEILEAIKMSAEEQSAKIIIIDNLTFICNGSESGDTAGEFMKELLQLKFKHGLSVLIIAHTPKRIMANPITQNDLAGSKRLFNFFDSAFAIGKSAKSEKLRYIKHLKARVGSIVYGTDNVLLCEIARANCALRFVEVGTDKEWRHLKSMDKSEQREIEQERVAAELKEGKSIREIAIALGMQKSKVGLIVKDLKNIEQ